jgi:DNA topoisomerase-1
MGTILNRGYVYKKGTALVPAWLAFSVIRLLEEHFSRLVSYEFTATMEDVLDEIAAGRRDRNTELAAFYFGEGDVEGLEKLVSGLGDIDARELATFPVGEGINLRVGRYGPYVEDTEGKRGNVPEDLPPDELDLAKAKELLANPAGQETELGADPESGHMIVAKNGRFGPYVTEVLPEDAPKSRKPRTSSLFKTMSLDSLTLDDALKLLTLPRVVGADPESKEEITAQNGRYGPYLKKGTDSRSIDDEEKLLTITLEEALAVYAQPKARGRAAANPGREIGEDPTSGTMIVVKSGRFGPYVTDGEYNATLRQGDDEATLTLERAAELLADKRAKGPAPAKKGAKKAAKKSTAKKSATKKSTAKKTTKKTTKKAAKTS